MQLKVTISKESMDRLRTTLHGISKDIDQAMVYAINETLPGVKTDIVAELQQEINLPKSVLLHGPTTTGKKPTFFLTRATINSISGKVSTSGVNINLVHYRTAPKSLTSYKPRVIKVQVKKSRPEYTLRHVFIPRLRSGHKGFFVVMKGEKTRTGKQKIKELYGPRIPDILSNPEPTARVMAKVNTRLEKNLTRAANRVMVNNNK